MKKLMNKKGLSVVDMVFYGLIIVVLGISLAIGARINDKMDDGMTGTAADAIANSTEGIAELASWSDTIALVIAGMVILGLVFGLFTLFRGARQ